MQMEALAEDLGKVAYQRALIRWCVERRCPRIILNHLGIEQSGTCRLPGKRRRSARVRTQGVPAF